MLLARQNLWGDMLPPGPVVPPALLLARFLEPVTYGWQENLLATRLRSFVGQILIVGKMKSDI